MSDTSTKLIADANTKPAGSNSSSVAMREPTTFILSKSKVVVEYDADPSVAQVLAAQKAAGKESGLFILYLAQATATFNGEKWTMGQIREKIRGKDYLSLASEMLGDKSDDRDIHEGNLSTGN